MRELVWLVLVIAWVTGTILAAGWLKLVAFCIPFYSWYLVVQFAMKHYGLI